MRLGLKAGATGLLVVFAAALLLIAAQPAEAVIVPVATRAALGGNDTYDWSSLGPCGPVTDPATVSSGGGLPATVNNPSGVIERRTQSDFTASCFWNGNFAPGDNVLYLNGSPGPLDITFSSAVMGVGTQIQRDAFGSFMASIQWYDPTGTTIIGSHTVMGNSTSNADNSAVFLGILSTAFDITRVAFSVDGVTQDFGINQMDIVGPTVVGVPEPSSLVLIVTGLVALIGMKRMRSRGVAA